MSQGDDVGRGTGTQRPRETISTANNAGCTAADDQRHGKTPSGPPMPTVVVGEGSRPRRRKREGTTDKAGKKKKARSSKNGKSMKAKSADGFVGSTKKVSATVCVCPIGCAFSAI